MSTLEAALRGGAVVVLLLRIVMLARNARSNQASRYSIEVMPPAATARGPAVARRASLSYSKIVGILDP
jgi:hypothetical protein